ncbi:hypothetical protein IW261DRAFT_1519871 [Armillaria novae-zelandiae]|uniref:Uncharacterized protein n=1 Tax=Armillaria novae-zelandiae TaxID=153914 RepID=A0AA39NKT9_9AGAR|nr:hypothetical protein IW261DRAFT_1519871 [Armillaria novae-zelandiae]
MIYWCSYNGIHVRSISSTCLPQVYLTLIFIARFLPQSVHFLLFQCQLGNPRLATDLVRLTTSLVFLPRPRPKAISMPLCFTASMMIAPGHLKSLASHEVVAASLVAFIHLAFPAPSSLDSWTQKLQAKQGTTTASNRLRPSCSKCPIQQT